MPHSEQSEHIDERELELYLKAQLSNEAVAAIDAHLGCCQVCVDKLAEQDQCLSYLAELMNDDSIRVGERRRYPRVVTDESASLQMLNPFSTEIWEIRVMDVSQGGLRTHTPAELPPGSLIRVKMRFSEACGDVRYCIPADNGFYAGVRIHDYFFH